MKNKLFPVRNLFLAIMALSVFTQCNTTHEGNAEDASNGQTNDTAAVTEQSRMYTLPTPVQMVAAISSEGVKYDPLLLNPSQRNVNYSSNFSRALNMGIYCVDLGYSSFFDQKQIAINYLSAIKKLSDELGVLGAFDTDLVKRYENNINNRDTVIHLILDGFNKTHNFLVENSRNEIMILCFAGSYLEGLHLSANVALQHLTPNMNRVMIEEKFYLDNLINLLEPFSDKEEYAKLLSKLDTLRQAYSPLNLPDLSIATESTYDISKIKVTTEQVKAIQEAVDAIRKEIIG